MALFAQSFLSLDALRPLLQVVAVALAAGAALYVERTCARRGLLPPGFRVLWRRGLAFLLLASLFWVAVFGPLALIGTPTPAVDFAGVGLLQLFGLQILLSVVTLGWFGLGFAVRPRPVPAQDPQDFEVEAAPPEPPVPAPPTRLSLGRQFAAQLGFRTPRPHAEIGFGLVAGLAIWFAVIAALFLIALLVVALGGERLLPKQAPAMVPWIAGLPIGIRILLSLSAGVVEETFFRGLLQPRVGIAFSTTCFVLAHAGYGSPFMLIGVTLLSLIYALLVRWRQNIWPAIVAHALFDGIQLLVVIPAVLRYVKS